VTSVGLVVLVTTVGLVGLVVLVTTAGLVGLVVLVTTVVLVVLTSVVLVVLVTTAGLVVPAALVTSAGLVVPVTSAGLVVPTTSDLGLRTHSAGGEVPRGVTEQRLGVGERRHEPDGAGPSRLREASGTKGRSTTGATTRPRYGIRAKTAGASTSSESGSRSNQAPAQ
jgi:hypothetical protein